MKISEIKNMKKAKNMPLGTEEVTFKKIQYRTDAEDNITGVFVHVEEYRSLFIPFFDNGDNYQLDLLLEQLGVDEYDPDEINKAAGTKIKVSRYKRDEYTNTSFNPRGIEAEETFA